MRRRGLRYCVRCWTCLPPTLLRNNPWSSEPKTGGLYENRSLYSSVLLYTWHILTIIHHIIWILYLIIVIQSHSLTSCWQTGSHSLSFQVLKITSCKSIEAGQPWWIMREPNYKPCFCILFKKKSIIGVCYWVYLTTWLFFFPGLWHGKFPYEKLFRMSFFRWWASRWDTSTQAMLRVARHGTLGNWCPSCQWEFQDPKMKVLYHIRSHFVGISPYIYGRYLLFRFLKWPLILGMVNPEFPSWGNA